MASLNNVNQMFKELKAEFTKPKADLKKCGTLLENLKVNMTFHLNWNQISIIKFNFFF